MKKVAFICVHNSCRSQIAEALGKHFAADVFESYSAGTETKPPFEKTTSGLIFFISLFASPTPETTLKISVKLAWVTKGT